MNTHVTFEQYESYCDLKLLQLLYDKGFRFKLETEGHRVINNLAEQRFNEGDVSYCNNYITYSAVIEWLRVNHGIWIYVLPYSTLFRPYAEELVDNDKFGKWEGHKYSTPQEAYNAAFDYILNNNLIWKK
jgi:hypothetical protein